MIITKLAKRIRSSCISRNFSSMKFIGVREFGDPSVLEFQECDIPKCKPNQVLIKVQATSLNRADTIQRQGKYPPPKGTTDIIGLEAVGYLCKPNGEADQTRRVMALLPGGGHAQYCAVERDHIIDIPNSLSFTDAAAITEVWLTAFQLLKIANAQEGDAVGVYSGASGVGTALIQLIKHIIKGKSFTVTGSDDKCEFVRRLGADHVYNYKATKDLAQEILSSTNNNGVNVLLDCLGQGFFSTSSKIIARDGRWIIYGLMTGAKVKEVNLASLMAKRARIEFSTLRSRSDEDKAKLIEAFKKEVLPGFESKTLKPIIDKIVKVDWKDIKPIQDAHTLMESNKTTGKIVFEFTE